MINCWSLPFIPSPSRERVRVRVKFNLFHGPINNTVIFVTLSPMRRGSLWGKETGLPIERKNGETVVKCT